MSNIDTNNCKFKDKFYGTCEATRDKDGECELACFDCKDCYYRQLQQLKAYIKEDLAPTCQRLQAENDELRKSNTSNAKAFLKENKEKHKLLDCIDEIEEIVEQYSNNGIELSVEKQEQILQLIKQAKEGNNEN